MRFVGGVLSPRLAVPARWLRRRFSHRAVIDLPTLVTGGQQVACGRRLRLYRRPLRANAEEAKANGAFGQAPLDFEELTDLIRMVNDSDIVDFEIENKGVNLSIKKAEAIEEKIQVVQGAMAPSPPIPSYSTAPPVPESPPNSTPSPSPSMPPPTPVAQQKEENAVPDGMQIVSPMSGCFYAAPAPGEPSFVKEGDRVTAGQTVCIIEAMKLMNEIEAEISGEVIKVLAQNGQSITSGQALMIVKPV